MFNTSDLNEIKNIGTRTQGRNKNKFKFDSLDPLNVTDDSLNVFNVEKKDAKEKCVSYIIDPTSSYGFMSQRTLTLYKTNAFESNNNDF